jgi:dihydropteroate synthase
LNIAKLIAWDRPIIVGILNLTPDSFSDGGVHTHVDMAVGHAQRMIDEGADIIDVGGESTRPGAARVPADEQIQRVVPVLKKLRTILPAQRFISIDTTRSDVAAAALDAGADLVNDVSAGRDDPNMFNLLAEGKTPMVLMHMRGQPEDMQQDPQYDNVVTEVRDFLIERATIAEATGIARDQILLDPGIGFGKTKLHNLQLLAGLETLVGTGYPVLLSASRKRFMGNICQETEPRELLGATCATTALGVAAGVRFFRVHDVKENRQAADTAWAILSAEKNR